MLETELSYKGKTYPVKFHHVRFLEGDKKVPSTNGGVTFASIEIDNDKCITEKAVCSLRDHFNKKIGRMMAMGRLRKKLKNEIDIDKPPVKLVKDIIYDIIYRC